LRSVRSRWDRTDIEMLAPIARPEDGGSESAASIAVAFPGLPPRLRVAATLALIEERPYAETADALGVPVGTVKSRVFLAIRTLRRELARLGTRV
jgi:DNA-directed RNA polymerase specialized sigma24 family protein